MSHVFGIRLSNEERHLVDEAAKLEQQLGDRGGSTAWARRVLLREAKKLVEHHKRVGEAL